MMKLQHILHIKLLCEGVTFRYTSLCSLLHHWEQFIGLLLIREHQQHLVNLEEVYLRHFTYRGVGSCLGRQEPALAYLFSACNTGTEGVHGVQVT